MKNSKDRKVESKNYGVKKNIKSKKKNIRPITVINYAFLVSLVLSIIFGAQTNMNFLIPFTIVLIITIVCMGIILINAIYTKIRKKFKK